MKRKEIVITVSLMIGALLCLFLLRALFSSREMICIRDAQGNTVLEVPLNENGLYTVKGKVGTFHLEVKDGTYRAVDVECPNHDCEKTGIVSKEDYRPIICLPNGLIVELIK
ncbi:MAG: NusG domain II-containing protein [Erysipelotrichaceae bacterium]|nr:NusG domain II-containing protein [Erysipelotrichaceae bacterium]